MATPYESAELILRLYDLRREAKMREARDWYTLQFHPSSAQDVKDIVHGEHGVNVRMVLGYWETAASLVVHDAISPEMFHDTGGEALGVFCKVEHLLDDLRELVGTPDYLKNLRKLADGWPGAAERMAHLREMFRELASDGA
ncbi:MAG: hypothetical protein IH968_09535 [Gemmatimonadetes bacterium]|nr:hypothetical protein [Gemmatimonadota bacterium]